MEAFKQEFIEFMVRSGVLTFGDFVTKSGRRTPYFINTGNYKTGEQMEKLGHYYAAAIHEVMGTEFDNLYGPAYKGIPLCVAASIALHRDFGHNVTYTFNRKEAKDHGEKGSLIGYQYKGGERIVIIEDVTTAGTSVRETVEILKSACPQGVDLRALIVSADRMERGTGSKSALAELADEFGIKTFPIVNIDEITAHLSTHDVDGHRIIDAKMLDRIRAYRKGYGA